MKNLSGKELKNELKKYVYQKADELVWELKKRKTNNSFNNYVKNWKICIK